MTAWGHRAGVAAACVVMMAAEAVAAQGSEATSATESVLVAPVQGSEALRTRHGERILGAVRGALDARGYPETVAHDFLGQAVVACQTPECVEQALDAAGAAFAIVPAIWSRETGGEELTLTLLRRSGRSLNARGVLGEDLSGTAGGLVDELLTRRAAAARAASEAAGPSSLEALPHPERPAPGPAHPHAWKAGPILVVAGGAAAIIAVGVAAGIRNDTQQLNTAAVAAWSVVGAAAIAGGITWWVVGEKRRARSVPAARAGAATIAFHPTGIDLRLRF